MKRAAFVVVLLYAAALTLLIWPLVRVAFWGESIGLDDVYGEGIFWLFVAVMVTAQALLLVVPVRAAGGRPVPQRGVIWTVLASGLAVGGLVTAAVACVVELVERGDAFNTALGGYTALAVGLVTWAVWTALFYRAGLKASTDDLVARHTRWLVRGSLLELLIAVPTHIVARQRHYCCAGVYTFTGIAVGTAVMLLAYGPAVFVLFAARYRDRVRAR